MITKTKLIRFVRTRAPSPPPLPMHIQCMYTQWGQILAQVPGCYHKSVDSKWLILSYFLKSPTAKSRRRFQDLADSQILKCHEGWLPNRKVIRVRTWLRAQKQPMTQCPAFRGLRMHQGAHFFAAKKQTVRNLHANRRLTIIILLSKNKMYGIRVNHRKTLIFKTIICYIFCARRLSGSGFYCLIYLPIYA